jgi:hypothetical protein
VVERLDAALRDPLVGREAHYERDHPGADSDRERRAERAIESACAVGRRAVRIARSGFGRTS